MYMYMCVYMYMNKVSRHVYLSLKGVTAVGHGICIA